MQGPPAADEKPASKRAIINQVPSLLSQHFIEYIQLDISAIIFVFAGVLCKRLMQCIFLENCHTQLLQQCAETQV